MNEDTKYVLRMTKAETKAAYKYAEGIAQLLMGEDESVAAYALTAPLMDELRHALARLDRLEDAQ